MSWVQGNKKIVVYFVLLILAAYLMPVKKNWTESYSQNHNWPYGADVTKDVWQDMFPDNEITVADLPIWNTVKNLNSTTDYLYVLFDNYLEFDTLDINSLLDFVADGNSALLSSYNIDYRILDTLHVDEVYSEYDLATTFVNGIRSSTFEQDFFEKQDSNYTFTIKNYDSYFTSIDSIDNSMIALAHGKVVEELTYVKVPFGDGYFYLHNQPLLLTNYYVLQNEGKRYLEQMASYLPSNDIIWDNNYKAINQLTKASPLNVILKHEGLSKAYWLTIIGLLLLFVFRIKRRQRIIPVVEPPKNHTLDFTNTMGRLYFNTASNKTLAMKKITILKEYLTKNLYMSDIVFDKNDATEIANKTNIPKDRIEHLFNLIKTMTNASSVSNGQLRVLNKNVNALMEKEGAKQYKLD